jgi:hypothetical protein
MESLILAQDELIHASRAVAGFTICFSFLSLKISASYTGGTLSNGEKEFESADERRTGE